MALSTPVVEVTATSGFTGDPDHETGSFSVTAGDILEVFASQSNSAGATAPGALSIGDSLGGLSWTLHESVPQDSGAAAGMRTNIWTAVATSTTTGTITVTGTDVFLASNIAVTSQSGQHATTPVPQSEQNTIADTSTTLAVTLGSAPASTSTVIGAVANEDDDTTGTIAPADGDFTELSDVVTAATFEIRLQVQYRLNAGASGQVCDWTGLTAGFMCKSGVAIEVAEAAGGGGAAPPLFFSGVKTVTIRRWR